MKRLFVLMALFGTVIITGASNPTPAHAGFSDGGDRATTPPACRYDTSRQRDDICRVDRISLAH
jgi:hypothetical protein